MQHSLSEGEDLIKKATERLENEGANFKAFSLQSQLTAGLESALFGRMVTSDILANMDAAIHVAHAFTVHEQEVEIDYLTVVDDCKQGGSSSEQGSGGIFDVELTSGLFYGYVVVDVPLLVSNLSGCKSEDWRSVEVDRSVAGEVVKNLIHLIAKQSPGAKKGSTAPYSWAECTLVEAGCRQPRTLANAFRAVQKRSSTDKAFETLKNHLQSLDECYGKHESRRMASTLDRASLEDDGELGLSHLTFDELADWVSQSITRGDTKASGGR